MALGGILVASSGTSLCEAISGKQIGDGSLTRYLAAASILSGGVSSSGVTAPNSVIGTTARLSRAALTGVSQKGKSSGTESSGDRIHNYCLRSAVLLDLRQHKKMTQTKWTSLIFTGSVR